MRRVNYFPDSAERRGCGQLVLESSHLARGERKMRFHQAALLVAIACAAIPASAQSLCELVPAAVVQSTLGIPVTLTAAPNTQGGNGCDYKGASTGPITLTADTISDAGIYKTIFDQRLHSLGPTQQLVSGVGDAPPTTTSNSNSRSPNTPASTSPGNPSSSAPRVRSSISSSRSPETASPKPPCWPSQTTRSPNRSTA